LPHWNWEGHEGETIPIVVYTSYPKAELFINGISQGIREKNDSTVLNRYRLMWKDTKYEPGEIKVIAYDKNNNAVDQKVIKTTGKAHHLVLTPNKSVLAKGGDDLMYITVQVADKDGNIVPTDTRKITFSVTGNATFEATANGDPTCLLPFQEPQMNLFSGAATLIVRSTQTPGIAKITAKGNGVKNATLTFKVE
jgi:beta-galactosidase